MNVLFVCSGNICRSPMAEVLMRSVAEAGGKAIAAHSAGTLGIDGAPASAEAVVAIGEVGLDLTGHRSKGVTAEHVAEADVVVAMTHAHLLELAARFPRVRTARFVVRAFENGPTPAPEAPDLEDPIGHPVDVYREQIVVIRRCVEHLATYLERVR